MYIAGNPEAHINSMSGIGSQKKRIASEAPIRGKRQKVES